MIHMFGERDEGPFHRSGSACDFDLLNVAALI
jgi:hypothetical protein